MKNFNPNLYNILGRISRHANDAEIKEAYRTLAKHYHPDKNLNDKAGAEEKMTILNEAYSILKDPKKRAEYNAKLLEHDTALRNKEAERIKKEAAEKRKKQTEETKKNTNHTSKPKRAPVPSSAGGSFAGAALAIVALGLLFAALSDD